METYQSRLAGSPEVRAESRTARWRHVTIGLLGYFVPAVLLAFGISTLVEAIGVDVNASTSIAVVAVSLAVVLWRGGTVSAAVRPDGLWIRNRWRQLLVPWDQVESADVGSSITYALFDLIEDVRGIANDTGPGVGEDDDLEFSDVLLIERRGRRRRLPVYATLGLTRHPVEMRPFLDAIAAHGIDLQRQRPSPTDLPPPGVGTP